MTILLEDLCLLILGNCEMCVFLFSIEWFPLEALHKSFQHCCAEANYFKLKHQSWFSRATRFFSLFLLSLILWLNDERILGDELVYTMFKEGEIALFESIKITFQRCRKHRPSSSLIDINSKVKSSQQIARFAFLIIVLTDERFVTWLKRDDTFCFVFSFPFTGRDIIFIHEL